MVKEVFENIFLIEVPLPDNPLKNLNSYYVKGDKRSLLIDTGFNCDSCFHALSNGLKAIEADMDKTDIFLTHLHSDHTGLSKRIASKSSCIYISSVDKMHIESFHKNDYWEMKKKEYLSLGLSEEEFFINKETNPIIKYLPEKDTIYTTVEEGHLFDLGGICLKAVSTPGHTPGHMCLVEEEKEIMFSGDHIIFDISPNISPLHGVKNALGMYLDSLNKTRNMKVENTLSAHRSPIGVAEERALELIEHHRLRLEEVERLLSDNGKMTAYEVAREMTWSVKQKSWGEFPPHQKWFAVGETYAHLEYLESLKNITSELINGTVCFYID
jgi:glyoxylase-like metal-dependent hydrolase (beta-lactamase superfamily II)